MEEFDSDVIGSREAGSAKKAVNSTAVLWGISALILSIFLITYNNAAMVLGAGFWAKTFAVIVGTILGTIGALIGDALRKFARPSAVFTRGGFFQLIWVKVFWSIGPQSIGLLIGALLGLTLVLN